MRALVKCFLWILALPILIVLAKVLWLLLAAIVFLAAGGGL